MSFFGRALTLFLNKKNQKLSKIKETGFLMFFLKLCVFSGKNVFIANFHTFWRAEVRVASTHGRRLNFSMGAIFVLSWKGTVFFNQGMGREGVKNIIVPHEAF